MNITPRRCLFALLVGLPAIVVDAAGDEPKPHAAKSAAVRNVEKIPTKIAGEYAGGELHGNTDTLIPTNANATELARRYREFGGEATIVLLDLPAAKKGHDGPELYESAELLEFLLAE